MENGKTREMTNDVDVLEFNQEKSTRRKLLMTMVDRDRIIVSWCPKENNFLIFLLFTTVPISHQKTFTILRFSQSRHPNVNDCWKNGTPRPAFFFRKETRSDEFYSKRDGLSVRMQFLSFLGRASRLPTVTRRTCRR